jgi:hypothetical protein
LLLIFLADADALVAHQADDVLSFAVNRKMDRRTRFRILDGVAEQVGEDVRQQPFIGLRLGGNGIQR